jgi:hypothetical protein
LIELRAICCTVGCNNPALAAIVLGWEPPAHLHRVRSEDVRALGCVASENRVVTRRINMITLTQDWPYSV